MKVERDHEHWLELAAAHALSALDDADEAEYLRHAAGCPDCQQLERDVAATLADVAQAAPGSVPPSSLKSSIMDVIATGDDATAPAVDELGARRVDARRSRSRRLPGWISAAAAVIVVAAGLSAWAVTRPTHTSIVARCASAHCPTVSLAANGQPVARVLVLDDVAYVQPTDLPAMPAGHSYVLWRISDGHPPVGVAALRIKPHSEPVKAGALSVPVSSINAFALSEEPGDTVPAAPTHVLAQGAVS